MGLVQIYRDTERGSIHRIRSLCSISFARTQITVLARRVAVFSLRSFYGFSLTL